MGWSRQERIEQHDKMVVKLPDVQAELKRRFPEIVSVDVGMRQVKGVPVEEMVWRVFVRQKKKTSELKPEDMIPKEIAGWRTDVHQEMQFGIIEDSKKYRPLWGGMQAYGIGTGTLGCFVSHNVNNHIHLLSNHHVIGGNTSTIVDKGGFGMKDCCCCECGGFATVTQGIVGSIGGGAANQVDAAIAILWGQTPAWPRVVHYTNSIIGIGPIFGSNTTIIGDVVRKRGRTTELTVGRVQSITADANVGKAPNTVVYSNNQIHILSIDGNPFAKGGDSGSVIVDNRNQVVGLMPWSQIIDEGPPRVFGPNAKANLISNVEALLSVSVLSSGTSDTFPIASIGELTPPIAVAEPNTFLKKLESRLQETTDGTQFLQVVQENRGEVMDLINDNREVKVAWNRYQGPSFVGHLVKNINEPEHPLPADIGGYSLQNLLIKMSDVLERHGSRRLSQAVEDYSNVAFQFADKYQGFDSIDNLVQMGGQCPNCGTPNNLKTNG